MIPGIPQRIVNNKFSKTLFISQSVIKPTATGGIIKQRIKQISSKSSESDFLPDLCSDFFKGLIFGIEFSF